MKPKTISAYHHTRESEQQADPEPGQYYVSVRDGQRTGLLFGPVRNHQTALNLLPTVKAKAMEVCRDAVWYAWGTLKMKENFNQPGVLNKFFTNELQEG